MVWLCAAASADDIVKRVFTLKDGLGNTTINDISFDTLGFVWVATEQGLYRVSNEKIRRVDKVGSKALVSDDYITHVINIDKENLLIGSYTNLYLYNIYSNTFTEFGTPELFPHFQASGLADHARLDADTLLLLSYSGELQALSIKDKTLTDLATLIPQTGQNFDTMQLLSNGHLLIANEAHIELRQLNGALIQAVPWQAEFGHVKQVYQDSLLRVWVTSSEGLFQIATDNWEVQRIEELPFYLSTIQEDDEHNLWLAGRSGLLHWSPQTRVLNSYQQTLKQRADIEYVTDISITAEGLVWVGGAGDGIAVLTLPPDFLLATMDNLPPYYIGNEVVWSIYAEENDVWLGTDGGVVKVDQALRRSQPVIIADLELNDSVYKIDPLDDDHLLISTTNGLYVIHKKNSKSQRFSSWAGGQSSLELQAIYNSYQDPMIEGRIWFATYDQLFYWQPGMLAPQLIQTYRVDGSNKPLNINSMFRDSSGTFWVAGEFLFGHIQEDGAFYAQPLSNALNGKLATISQIIEPKPGKLWLGTGQQGVVEFDIASGEFREVRGQWNEECGAIYFFERTPTYTLIGCDSSIVRLDEDTGGVIVVSQADGLIGNELNEGAVYYAPEKGLYVGTPDGAMLLDTHTLTNRIPSRGIVLESIAVYFEHDTDVYLVPERLKRVAPGAKMISFQLSNFDYLNDAPLKLKYRIRRPGDSSEMKYLALEGQSQVNFSGLTAGHYTLDVLSLRHGVWQTEPFSFPFQVDQHWWQSRLFKLVVILWVVGVIYMVAWNRKRRVTRFQRINTALTESDQRLRQSLKGSDSDLWEWDRQTDVLQLDNRSGVLETPNDKIISTLDALPIHPSDRERVNQAWQKLIQGEVDRFDEEYRFRIEGLDWRWLRVKGSPVDVHPKTGAFQRVAGIYSDVTVQRTLESEVSLLAQAFGNTTEGVLILDANERIQVANAAAEKILGLDKEQLKQHFFSELVCKGHVSSDEVMQLLSGKDSWTGEQSVLCQKTFEPCPVWLNISVMRGHRNKLKNYVVVFSDITERKEHEANLRRLANHDVLTGLINRSAFSEHLKLSIHEAQESHQKLALLFLDLDRFKHVNDSFGHGMGDALLMEASARLQHCIGHEQALCRFGGDEFVILANHADDLDKINHLAERILAQFLEPFELFGREFHISTSIGISIFPDDARSSEGLIKNADLAMYHAKDEGRGNFQYYSSERNEEALYHLRLEADLRKAIERNEFELHYQPQIDIEQGETLVGMEALIRWKHPIDGYIRPDIFIGVAEGCGLILEIEHWVLQQACRQGALWSQRTQQAFKLSINISAVHFRQANFVADIQQVLEATQMPKQMLCLEITEGVLMKELHVARSHLKALKQLGISVAIDDFGTGYSSLAYLSQFEVDTLKIDRSFLINLAHSATDQAIVSSIIELARHLKMDVVAEGVETQEQLEQVFERGCSVIQGYYFSKPLPHVAMQQYMEQKLDY